MMHLVPISSYDVSEAIVFSLIIGSAIGYIAGAVMGDNGFGGGGNTLLAILGSIAALLAAKGLRLDMLGDQAVVGAGASFIGAIGLLLLSGLLRRLAVGRA